jgi:hypothetical protein
MIRLLAAHLPCPVREAFRDCRSAFEVSSFAYLLRNASNLAPSTRAGTRSGQRTRWSRMAAQST